jgi:hypothetical protein
MVDSGSHTVLKWLSGKRRFAIFAGAVTVPPIPYSTNEGAIHVTATEEVNTSDTCISRLSDTAVERWDGGPTPGGYGRPQGERRNMATSTGQFSTTGRSNDNKIRRSFATAIVLMTTLMVSSSWAQMQDFGNRQEGTTVHVDALEDLTVVALHRTFAPFSRNADLSVRFFLPKLPNDRNRDVFVEAVELQDSVHYLMHSKNTSWTDGNWNVFGQWPTKDVIDRLGIDSENLGVLAQYRMASSPPVYLPVDVYQNDKQLTKHAYTVHFITGQDLQALDVSVTDKNGMAVNSVKQHLACNKTFNRNCKLFAAGSTQALDLDMTSVPEGEYFVKLTGHVPGSSTPTSLDIALYHRP